MEPDMRFHAAMIEALGSARTSRMYAGLVSEVKLCRSQLQGQKLLSAAEASLATQGPTS
jgi:hypothetical protein